MVKTPKAASFPAAEALDRLSQSLGLDDHSAYLDDLIHQRRVRARGKDRLGRWRVLHAGNYERPDFRSNMARVRGDNGGFWTDIQIDGAGEPCLAAPRLPLIPISVLEAIAREMAGEPPSKEDFERLVREEYSKWYRVPRLRIRKFHKNEFGVLKRGPKPKQR
jgi:hypothetical protein